MSLLARLASTFCALAVSVATAQAEGPPPKEIEIVVDAGYSPARVEVQAGAPVRLKFVRKGYSGCTKELVFPALDLRRELPTGKPVVVDLPATLSPGEYEWKCGMNMARGAVVVSPKT